MVSKRWTWVIATALLFAGVTNAHSHVHYCFDGRDPAAAVFHVDALDHDHAVPTGHAHDPAVDHDDHDGDHDDLDLDVPNDAIAKSLKHDTPTLGAMWLWTAEFHADPGAALAESFSHPPAPDPPYSHAQSRAPPR